MIDDFDAGYKAGYNKAYTEMYDFIYSKIKNSNKSESTIKGAEGIPYIYGLTGAQGPTGYIPDYYMGANGPQGPTAPTSWNVYDDNGNIVGVQGIVNAYDHNYRKYM